MGLIAMSALKKSYSAVAILGMVGFLSCSLVGDVAAHKVNVFAYVEGEEIIVEGYFSGNVKAQNCQIEVFDSSGKKLLEGKTDSKGIFKFRLKDLPSFKGELKIVLNAGMGHRGEYILPESDLPSAPAKESSETDQHQLTAQKEGAKQLQQNGTDSEPAPNKLVPRSEAPETSAIVKPPLESSTSPWDESALQRSLEAVLDKKLAPIVRMLGNQEKMLIEERMKGPKMSDIIGGIGWIIGLAGLAAFFLGKRRNSK